MIVYDHNHVSWRLRYDSHARVNGAYTYSQDIARWHLPVWRELLGPTDSIATCGKVEGATVQYIHERTHVHLSPHTRLFVTTYKDVADALGPRGLWLPNAIDQDALPSRPRSREGWVYFGNLVGQKRGAFKHLDVLAMDIVSGVSDQREALSRVSQYRYGIGVGRCALEMMAIGMKVLIFGKDLGGIIRSTGDFDRQRAANFNGNVMTGVTSLAEAIDRIEESIAMPVTFQEVMPELRQRIIVGWQSA